MVLGDEEGRTVPRWCAALCASCLGAAFLFVFLLVVLVSPFVSYNSKRLLAAPSFVLVLPGLVAVGLGVWRLAARRASLGQGGAARRVTRRRGRSVVVATIVLAVLQALLISVYRFSTGWDVRMVSESAWTLAHGLALDDSAVTYFQIYPNNMALLWVSTACMRLALALGATSLGAGEMVFSVLNCLVQAVAALALHATVRRLLGEPYALVGWGLLEAICLLSPWASIPYSDALALAVPSLTAWCYVGAYEGQAAPGGTVRLFVCSVACGFVGAVGYKVKPQTSFLLIAIVLIELLMLVVALVHVRRAAAVRHGGTLACLAAGVAVALALVGAASSSLALPQHDEWSLGPAHFLMMGANDVSDGGFLDEDVAYTLSFPDRGERTRADLARWRERVEAYGPVGLAQHSVRKLLSTYADGAFAWAAEGGFFLGLETDAVESGTVDQDQVDAVAAAASDASHPIDRAAVVGAYEDSLRGLVLSVISSDGVQNRVWASVAQALWLPVLLFVACAGLPGRGCGNRSGHDSLSTVVLALVVAMLGLFVFELLFEARARYLYSSLPLFVMLAMVGLRRLAGLLATRRAHASLVDSPRP